MSFGFGVGDILAVSKLARTTWKRFQDSSDQFKALRTEAANLCLVLDDVAQTAPGRELSEKEARTLSSLIQGCRDILADMDTMLQKYENLGTRSSSSGARTRKAWKKITWDLEEVNELRSRVISNTVSLDAFNSSLASKTFQAVKDDLTELTKRQDQQGLQAIINWLSPLQFPAQQLDTISRRQKGTGRWLIQSDQFNTWLKTTGETLFCSGIPGAGKTMLAAIAIDHVCNTIRSIDIGIVYIYCNYKMQLEQTPVNLVASLLKQLLQQHGVVSDDLKSLYCRHLKNETRPALDEVFKILQFEVNRYRQVFVVVDALDECSTENQVRQDLLSKLFALQTSHTVNLMFTSRHIPDIMREFQKCLQLEIRASEEDVRRYLDGQIFRLASCVRRNNDLQEAIKGSIVKAVDGIFLLAQLHLDSLKDKTSPKAIKNALGNLPQGSDALDRAYDQAMKRIDDQGAGFRQLADQVLAWITHAQRPLTIVELQHALAIEEGEPELDQENITDVGELVSVCVGLVAIDQETNIIRLVHYTTQEYFRRICMQRFPDARKTIAVACLTYLSFDVFAKEDRLEYDQQQHFESRLQQTPFLDSPLIIGAITRAEI
ncbi:hypothetical protein MMC22_003357 [Lobaria immixta]|nr:hypothetical protein [Lobaria immixta]